MRPPRNAQLCPNVIKIPAHPCNTSDVRDLWKQGFILINHNYRQTMHRRTPSQNLQPSATSSPILESPRSPAYTSASKFRSYQQQLSTPGSIPSIVTTEVPASVELDIHQEANDEGEISSRGIVDKNVLEEELFRYTIRSSDALQELRVDVSDLTSGKGCYVKRRRLYSDTIVTNIIDTQNPAISYDINRPLDRHQLFITSPLFPPRSAIPLQAESLLDDREKGLHFSVSISCCLNLNSIPNQHNAAILPPKTIEFQTFPSQMSSLHLSPSDESQESSNWNIGRDEVIPLSPNLERMESGQFPRNTLGLSRSANRLASSPSSDSTSRHSSERRQSWMQWSRGMVPSLRSFPTLGSLSPLSNLSTSTSQRRARNDQTEGIWGTCLISSGKSFVILCPPGLLPPPPPPSPSIPFPISSSLPSPPPPPLPRRRPILLFRDTTPLYSTTTQGEMIIDESVVRCLGVERGFWVTLALGVLEAEEERVGWMAEN